jgi:formate hydrogenlyase subunit 4
VTALLHPLALALAALVLPFALTGVINRVKSLWSGRRGPPIFQLAFDVLRLLRKSSVYSETTTPVFRVAPYVTLVTSVAALSVTPLLGGAPFASFRLDFVWLAYAWGLGRVAVMLAALDTGSSFEGMGAAREATFAAVVEPALFLLLGALCLAGGAHTLHDALFLRAGNASEVVRVAAVVGLTIVLQVETSRMPVDDPTTHLELTMIHEVMILDHSGPDLAAIEVGSAVKLLVLSSAIATLLNPLAGPDAGLMGAAANVALTLVVGGGIGTVESLFARLKMKAVPQYVIVALSAGVVALLATTWQTGTPQ